MKAQNNLKKICPFKIVLIESVVQADNSKRFVMFFARLTFRKLFKLFRIAAKNTWLKIFTVGNTIST